MKKLLLVVALVACVIVYVVPAQATSHTFDLDYTFSGSSPGSTTPWLRAVFDDKGTSGTVTLTMKALNLTASTLTTDAEFVTEWDFNFGSPGNLDNLIFAWESGPTADVSKGINAYKADGDGWYDIMFNFPQKGGPSAVRFEQGMTSVYNITGADITADSFKFLSIGGDSGSYYTAAHVQGIDKYPDSGWIGPEEGSIPPIGGEIPEPATMLLVGSGLVGLARIVRRKK